MEKKTIIILIGIYLYNVTLVGGGFIIGLYSMGFFEDDYEGQVLGFYTPNADPKLGIEKNILKRPGYKGQWICMNVEELNYGNALDVCAHEVGHYYYENECDGNNSKCYYKETEDFAELCELGYKTENKKLFKLG